jgi:hypothetical protein
VYLWHNLVIMKSITLEISEDDLREVIIAYRTLQTFLGRIVSPNELYTDEFWEGLQEARTELKNKDFIEVTSELFSEQTVLGETFAECLGVFGKKPFKLRPNSQQISLIPR